MEQEMNWSYIKRGRQEYCLKYKTVHKSIRDFPIVRSGKEVLKSLVKAGDTLIDIGANDRNVERFVTDNKIDARYFSYDIDRTLPHDFYDLEEIDKKFNICVAFDIVEHIPLVELVEIFTRVHGLLVPGGYFIVTTPNVCHPVIFWRDCTHITALRYDELGGLLLSSGFINIRLYRSTKMGFRKQIKYWLYKPLLELLEIDFARSIVMVAQV